MTKKQKKTVYEIIISAILLGLIIFVYPLIVKNLFKTSEDGFFYYFKVALFIVNYLIIGGGVLLKSLKNISKGRVFDEYFLMSLASIMALIMGEFFEGIAVMLFYQVGELFQSLAVSRSRKSIKSLIDLAPEYANLVDENNNVKQIDVDEVNVNDILLIKVGEKIPVDCMLLEGETSLDTSSLTGESLPKDVKVGDEILSGNINLTSVIKVKALKVYEDSSIYKILTLIEEANESKGKTEQFITKFAKYYTPIVVILAFLLAIIPPLTFDQFNFRVWILRAMSFLIVSCPCALVISIPLSFFSGIGKASKKGILIKGGNFLEELNKVDTIFFDKTGTLTNGEFVVTKQNIFENNEEFMSMMRSIEENSSHPLAKAIIKHYSDTPKIELEQIEEISGKGMKVSYKDHIYLCGNKKLLEENNIEVEEVEGTSIYLAKDKICLGYVVLEDKIKDDAKVTITKLKKIKVKNLIMITGDNQFKAEKVSKELNLTKNYASLLPLDKLNIVNEYKENNKVAYVGDGINDAPTLAASDVSFAMGKNGSSLAIESSDIVLMDDDLFKIYEAKVIAKQTMFVAYFNIILALSTKLICLILGALGIGGMLLAIFADVGVLIICVINALLNYYLKVK